MSEPSEKTPAEQAVELFVYAPIGLLFEGASLLPQLVEKGKSQVSMARMIGKFAVGQGRTEATKAAGKLHDQAAGVLDFLGDSVTPMPADLHEVDITAPPTSPEPVVEVPPARKATKPAARPVRKAATKPTSATSTTSLAIPDYDGLSASQVVNRLAGLSTTELKAVQAYETANRGRKTILSKVAQLQSA
ncbi:MAG: hypothetical protein ABIP36_04500 [Acidimicrobiales bacterium]